MVGELASEVATAHDPYILAVGSGRHFLVHVRDRVLGETHVGICASREAYGG